MGSPERANAPEGPAGLDKFRLGVHKGMRHVVSDTPSGYTLCRHSVRAATLMRQPRYAGRCHGTRPGNTTGMRREHLVTTICTAYIDDAPLLMS